MEASTGSEVVGRRNGALGGGEEKIERSGKRIRESRRRCRRAKIKIIRYVEGYVERQI